MKASRTDINNICTKNNTPVLELGRVTEGLGIDMNLYLLPCKAEAGLGSDIVPWEPRECTPVEIISSVAEAGSSSCRETATFSKEKPMTSVIGSLQSHM